MTVIHKSESESGDRVEELRRQLREAEMTNAVEERVLNNSFDKTTAGPYGVCRCVSE